MVAERTGCAVILIGHLNKAAGGQSAYRGLGSIDFRAAARSVLLIGRVKREPNVRVIVHDKSPLRRRASPLPFALTRNRLFMDRRIRHHRRRAAYPARAGTPPPRPSKPRSLILDLLADGKELASEDIVKAAAEAGISERTVKNARRNLDTQIEVIRRGNQWYYRRKRSQECKVRMQSADTFALLHPCTLTRYDRLMCRPHGALSLKGEPMNNETSKTSTPAAASPLTAKTPTL